MGRVRLIYGDPIKEGQRSLNKSRKSMLVAKGQADVVARRRRVVAPALSGWAGALVDLRAT